jgi:PTH1 family peptidyl-tRNA hydrolase
MAIKLIAGLGNPGPKYDKTRHNAGFWFVEELARRYQGRFSSESRFSADVARIFVDGNPVWMLKPTTFMNRSGIALRQLMHFYKIDIDEILVAHDELDLEPGISKLKRGGGHGGHNGLRDIFSHVGKDFWRLRIGIGHPGHRDQVVDYVLNPPRKEEAALIESEVDRAAGLVPLIVAGEFEKAMHQLHSR